MSRFQRRSSPAVIEALENRQLLTAAPPTGLIATPLSASAVAVHWDKSTDPAVTGYDVVNKYWVSVVGGGKGSHGGGHWAYTPVVNNLVNNTVIIGGLQTGHFYTYLVTAVSPSEGNSPPSLPITVETALAPSLPYGAEVLLSSGALWSSPIPATVGMATQITLLAGGNPLYYSIVQGPPTASVNYRTGVVTFTPTADEVGTVPLTLQAQNNLGSVQITISFDVTAQAPSLLQPTIDFTSPPLTYTGHPQTASAVALAADGVTPVAGTFSFAYNGSSAAPINAGVYRVLATFASADPNYASATRFGIMVVGKATPSFNMAAPQTVTAGDASTPITGSIWGPGGSVPSGEYVGVTLNGVTQYPLVSANGSFSANFDTSSLAAGTYPVTYSYVGSRNFNPTTAAVTLTVVPEAAPQITLQPQTAYVTAGDSATFTAAASGSPAPTVQWQVSTDNQNTWTNIYNPYGGTLYTGATSVAQSGYWYRAIFTNRVSSVTTQPVELFVEPDSGGGN